MSEPPPPPFSLDGSLGACLIGAVLGVFLYGLETLQTYTYYRRYPGDPRRLKALVAGIWIAELGQAISLWHALYQMMVTFFARVDHVLDPPHSLEMAILFSAITNVTVQTFFALRLRSLSGTGYIPALCCALTAARLVLSTIMLVAFWQASGFQAWRDKIGWAMLGVSVVGAVVDVVTAAALCVYLDRLRAGGARSYFLQTRRRVDTLLLWSVDTTTLTSVVGILQLVLFLTRKDLAWITFFLLQPKLLANSILAHLNGRERPGKSTLESGSLSSGSRGAVSSRGGGFGVASHGGGTRSGVSREPNRSVVVRMHHTTEIERDDGAESDHLKSQHDPKLHQL